MWQRFRLMNAAILCQRQWIREGTALTGRGGVAVWCFFLCTFLIWLLKELNVLSRVRLGLSTLCSVLD